MLSFPPPEEEHPALMESSSTGRGPGAQAAVVHALWQQPLCLACQLHLTIVTHKVRSRCCHRLEAFFASTPASCNMLRMTKANVETIAQATRERDICRAMRPMLVALWPEGAVLLYKPLSCDGPLYLRDHFSPCAKHVQLQGATSWLDLCCKGSWMTIKSLPGPWSCLSLSQNRVALILIS